MKVLSEYEKVSGQLINRSKSSFYIHEKTLLAVAIRLKNITGIKMGNFPFIYLGCPVYYGRSNATYFEEFVRKVAKRIRNWQNRFLSYRGKYVLVNHVLQSMPIYLLTALTPPKKVIKQIHQIFASSFWSKVGGEKGKHWVRWEDLCYPHLEDGFGFRSLQDVNKVCFHSFGGISGPQPPLCGVGICGINIVERITPVLLKE